MISSNRVPEKNVKFKPFRCFEVVNNPKLVDSVLFREAFG
jgi:hypothetical protein